MRPKSLFEKYGGFSSINRIVLAFYDAILDSDQLGRYFEEVDMRRLIDHQTKFVSGLLGGPVEIDDPALQRSHASLGVTDADFDEMKRIFGETLKDHGIEPADIAQVVGEIEARRSLIVG